MKLAKDSQGIYGVEVRKPILESTDTYCYVLKVSDRKNNQLLRQLVRFKYYIISLLMS